MNSLSFLTLKGLLIFILLIPLAALFLGYGFNLVDSGPSGWVTYVIIAAVLFILCGNSIAGVIKWKQHETL